MLASTLKMIVQKVSPRLTISSIYVKAVKISIEDKLMQQTKGQACGCSFFILSLLHAFLWVVFQPLISEQTGFQCL